MKPVPIFIGGVILFAMTHGGGAVDSYQHGQELQTRTAEVQRTVRTQRRESRNHERMAAVSLDRARGGCIPVGRPSQPGNESSGIIEGTILIEGMTVTDWNGMPFADGTLVCSATNTAVVMGGRVTSVAQVAAADREEYLSVFGALR